VKEKVDLIKLRYQNYLTPAEALAVYWLSQKLGRKTLAQQLFENDVDADPFLCSQIMKLYGTQDMDKIRYYLEDSVRKLLPGIDNAFGNPPKLAEILGLQDT